MAIQQAVAQRWVGVTGRPLIEGYGLSETSPVVTANPTNAQAYSGSIGLPLPSTEVRIVDEQGAFVETGERGEIAVRGPQVMRGYWNAPHDTTAAFTPEERTEEPPTARAGSWPGSKTSAQLLAPRTTSLKLLEVVA